MDTRLAQIDSKLHAYRLAAASPDKPAQLVNDIYKGVFQSDFYRDIWDEPVLLALQDLITAHPPKQDVFGQKLQFIKARIDHVVAMNRLFAALLFGSRESVSEAVTRLPNARACTESALSNPFTVVPVRRSPDPAADGLTGRISPCRSQ